MSKLYLIQAEDIPVYFDGTLQGERFIPDRLLMGGTPFLIPSGKLGFDDSDLFPDSDRPGVFHPKWERNPFKLLTFSQDGWEMVLRSNQEARLFAFKWREPNTNSWLGRFLPNCLVKGASGESEFTLRVLFDAQVREVRFDWTRQQDYTFSLLGVDLELPSPVTLSAILRQEAGATRLNRLALLLLNNQPITISSDFAWTRDLQREVLQFDPDNSPDGAGKTPAFQFELTPPSTDTLVLATITDLDGMHAPKFLRRCVSPVDPLDISGIAGEEFTWPTRFDFSGVQSLDIGNWEPNFTLLQDFTFPFLYSDGNGSGGLDKIAQVIEVSSPNIDLTPDSPAFSLSVPTKIKLGTLGFDSAIPFGFNCEDFAVTVDHPEGIDITISQERLEQSCLGLDWTFKPNQEGTLFTLVTEAYNYQLRMAEGAELILEFSQMSADPIRFRVSNFAVSGKGNHPDQPRVG